MDIAQKNYMLQINRLCKLITLESPAISLCYILDIDIIKHGVIAKQVRKALP